MSEKVSSATQIPNEQTKTNESRKRKPILYNQTSERKTISSYNVLNARWKVDRRNRGKLTCLKLELRCEATLLSTYCTCSVKWKVLKLYLRSGVWNKNLLIDWLYSVYSVLRRIGIISTIKRRMEYLKARKYNGMKIICRPTLSFPSPKSGSDRLVYVTQSQV